MVVLLSCSPAGKAATHLHFACSYAKRDTVSQREVVQMARELEVKGAQVEELEKRLKELEVIVRLIPFSLLFDTMRV